MDLTSYLSSLQGLQVTASESHPAWLHHVSGVLKGDLGGPFSSVTRRVEALNGDPIHFTGIENGHLDFRGNGEMAEYLGPLLPCPPSYLLFPDEIRSSDDVLGELGATAIARCSPSNPVADLSTFLGETLKDGIPAIIGSTLKSWRGLSPRKRRKAIGHEYLNYEFGWKPFVSDLQDISSAITHADALWAQYERDAGKVVRRRYEFPTKETSHFKNLGLIGPWLSPSSSSLTNVNARLDGKVVREDRTSVRQWFSGAFTYYLPTGNSGRDRVARNVIQAKKLLGLTLTPEVVWNLMPWSWAIDWFTNTGDILSNWSNWAIDGQVLWYGYMMEHSVSSSTYTYVGDTRLQTADIPTPVTLTTESKVRIQAGPYGFGLTWNGLSTTQKAIVAALGMSRKR